MTIPRAAAVLMLLLPLPLSALAADGPGPYSFTLTGKAFNERCLRIEAGESIRYRFRASAPVDFNIHYHRGADVFYPVQQSGLREEDTSFRAPVADDYCLMWQHTGPGVATIEGSLERIAVR